MMENTRRMRISCFAGSARCKLSGQQGLGHLQRCQLAAALHDRLLQCHSMSFRQLRPALHSGEDRGSSWQLLTQHRCGTGCSQLRPSRLQRYKSAFACGLLQVLVSAATCFLNPTVASAHRHLARTVAGVLAIILCTTGTQTCITMSMSPNALYEIRQHDHDQKLKVYQNHLSLRVS